MALEIPTWPQAGEREKELLSAVLESGQWGGFHPFIREFEQSFAAYQQSKYGIGACNGTLTIEAALSALAIGQGDEVIVPAISFVSTATAVSRVGAIPVFVDIEPYTFNINPERVRDALSPRTRAVMPVHFGGRLANMDALSALTAEHGLYLVEDAAHAQGSEWRGRRAGSFGICGSFSFQNGKVLSCGEGGIVVTSDSQLAERIVAIVNHGRKPGESFYKHFTLGSNLRMTAFQAAVLIAQFEALAGQIERRAANAMLLKGLLSDMPQIVWQHEPAECTRNSLYLLPGRLNSVDRDRFCRNLTAAGVPCTPFYPFPLYGNPLYAEGGKCRVMPCPVAEECVNDAFWLPHRLLLAGEETIREVAGVIRSAIAQTQ